MDGASGEVLKEGQILRMPLLANTLETISQQGSDVFYRGNMGQTLVEEIQHRGGVITMADLKKYK